MPARKNLGGLVLGPPDFVPDSRATVKTGRYVLVRVKGLEPPLSYEKQILS